MELLAYRCLSAVARSPIHLRKPGPTVLRRWIFEGYKPKDKGRSIDAPLKDKFVQNKDILLFRYEDATKMFWLNALALTMFPLWTYLSYFSLKLRENLSPLKEVMEEPQHRDRYWVFENVLNSSYGVAVGFFSFGLGLSGYWTSRTLNTVRGLILRKGGKHVTIITYGLLGRSSKFTTVPVSHCSGVRRIFQGKQRFFLHVKNHRFRYQLNVEDGIFSNKPLFDRTVGLSRNL